MCFRLLKPHASNHLRGMLPNKAKILSLQNTDTNVFAVAHVSTYTKTIPTYTTNHTEIQTVCIKSKAITIYDIMLLPAEKCNVQNEDKCELTISFSLGCWKLINALSSPVSTFDPEISFCFAVERSSSVKAITCITATLAQVQCFC